jgi:hypothetical protein
MKGEGRRERIGKAAGGPPFLFVCCLKMRIGMAEACGRARSSATQAQTHVGEASQAWP